MPSVRKRVETLEARAGINEPAKPTVAFFDRVLDGTVSEEEFVRYLPALREILPEEAFEVSLR